MNHICAITSSFLPRTQPAAPLWRALAWCGYGALLSAALSLPRPVHAAAAAAAAGAVSDAAAEAAEEAAAIAVVEFNEDLLRIPVDIRMYAEGNPVLPGSYRVDLRLNNQWKGRTEVRFEFIQPTDRIAIPCFDLTLLEHLGFDSKQFSSQLQDGLKDGAALCRPLGELIEGAQARYDSTQFRLDISAPQIALAREARGYVNPALWDQGITAGILNYDYNAYRSEFSGGGQTNQYLGLRGGVNFGAWRLRYRGSGRHTSNNGFQYRSDVVYLERALPKWRSKLTLGEAFTDGRVFDGISFLGAKLDSDDRMYPDSQRGYAPVVRGIAQSNARVRISQRGQTIMETTVPPGPFVIDDLYPNGMGGDLLVTIIEADGSESEFTVVYASLAELLRPGFTQYSLVAGRYQNRMLRKEPDFVMGTLRHGMTNMMTGYTGLIAAEGYAALSAGMALNLGIGALSTDVTHARTRVGNTEFNGHSVQMSYSKILPVIDTNITVASYRYSSHGYYSAPDAFQLRDRVNSGGTIGFMNDRERMRNRLMLNASQSLPGRHGHVAITASSQDYWQRPGRDTQYQLSYGRTLGRVSLGVAASRTRNVARGQWDNQYMLNMSVPLSIGRNPVYVGGNYTHSAYTDSLQANMSGSAGEHRQLSYSVFASAQDASGRSTQASGGGSASWTGTKARVSANASASRGGNRQYGMNVSGGLAAFSGGIVLTPQLGETIAIVEAKDAHGARLGHSIGARINRRGHGVAPWIQPYRQNTISLDPKGLSTDVELKTTSRQVVPTAGAIALIRFETERSWSLLLTGRRDDGSSLPFAAGIFAEDGRNVGYVAQGGQALIRVHEMQGTLSVRWGQEAGQSCRFTYQVPTDTRDDDFRRADVICVQGNAQEAGALNKEVQVSGL